MDRRKFLGSSALQLAMVNLMGIPASSMMRGSKTLTAVENKNKIQFRVLGKTGIRLPVVSMGVMNASNPNLLKAAWENGVRHFDTAWVYQNGNNEKMVGSVLRELKVNREDVTISTKVGLFGPPIQNGKERKEFFLKRFDESLQRLNMDWVDILYVHAISQTDTANDKYILEAFSDLKAKKKIRFSGFSTHSDWPDLVADTAKKKLYDVILLSFNYSMFQDERVFNSLKLAHEAGIGLVAMKTQCKQDWYKRELPANLQKFYEGETMNSALLKWVLRHEFITTAVPGFTDYQQLEQDMAVAYDLSLTKEEEDFFKSRDIQLAIQSVCRHCGSCVDSCPSGADIPSLMRTHMYALSYGNPLMAKQTLAQIQPGKGLDACMDCGKCKGECRNRVRIAERIVELKEIYC